MPVLRFARARPFDIASRDESAAYERIENRTVYVRELKSISILMTKQTRDRQSVLYVHAPGLLSDDLY